MRPLLVATLALVLPAAGARPAIAESAATPADSPGSRSSGVDTPDRYAMGGAGTLIVSRTAEAAMIVACVADAEASPRVAPDPLELARRGGAEFRWQSPFVSTWCATLPTSELPFALWLSAHLRAVSGSVEPAPAPTALAAVAPPDPRLEGRALSLEGAGLPATRPAHRVVSLAGGLPRDGLVALAARYFGTVPTETSDRPPRWSLHQTSERLSVLEGPEEVPVVQYGWAVPDDGPDVAAALQVAVEILAGRDEARLPRLLVPRGLARHVLGWSHGERGGTLLGVDVELTTRASIDRVRRFVDGSVKQLRLVGPSAREVSEASARLRRRALESWENTPGRARTLAELELEGGDARRFRDELESLSGVTPERVRSAAHEHLVDARRTTVELYPKLWPADDPAMSRHRLYTVVAGDSLDALAARFHVDAVQLAKENDVDPRYSLVPGQPLWIPP